MRTAIDSSVLWAIFKEENLAAKWLDCLVEERLTSALTLCEVVIGEIAPLFETHIHLWSKLNLLGVEFDPISSEAAFLAGHIFRQYRQQGGPRQHLIPDFLIGAHAMVQADRLLAVDRGYLRRYFPKLMVLSV